MDNRSDMASYNDAHRKIKQMQRQRTTVTITSILLVLSAILIVVGVVMIKENITPNGRASSTPQATNVATHPAIRPTATPTVAAFDPSVGAILPSHRVVAFYAVPGAEPTGPAYELSDDMLNQLTQQGNAYQKLDPAHPVQLGIDLVVSVPDGFPGPSGYYSHHVDADTIQAYIDFCKAHNLLLFLDLNFGWAPIMPEVDFFLPYLEKYTFVEMAVDPEWMFPRHDGIPGTNLSNVHASDLNPIIEAVGDIPMKYHVPRKILIIHEYRGSGDYTSDPMDAGTAEIADKQNIEPSTKVDVVIHVDSVGGYVGDISDKEQQYTNWVDEDMIRYENFRYGGFKLFYHIEAKTRLMTPEEVLALKPAPLVVTYGN